MYPLISLSIEIFGSFLLKLIGFVRKRQIVSFLDPYNLPHVLKFGENSFKIAHAKPSLDLHLSVNSKFLFILETD